MAEQYVTEFGKIAKQSSTIVVPANLADVASFLSVAMNVIRKEGSEGAVRR